MVTDIISTYKCFTASIFAAHNYAGISVTRRFSSYSPRKHHMLHWHEVVNQKEESIYVP